MEDCGIIELFFARSESALDETAKKYGGLCNENSYVFKWPDGSPFTPDYVTRHFNKLLKQNGLPHIRFHELRHSCASLLLSNGFTLKDVQEYMGHSDFKMTANIYGHLDIARKQALIDKLVNALF